MIIEIPPYSKEDGLTISWSGNFIIETSYSDKTIQIRANKAGLESLAIQLLTLAQDNVDAGAHIHYDDSNSLEDGSVELIIERA